MEVWKDELASLADELSTNYLAPRKIWHLRDHITCVWECAAFLLILLVPLVRRGWRIMGSRGRGDLSDLIRREHTEDTRIAACWRAVRRRTTDVP